MKSTCFYCKKETGEGTVETFVFRTLPSLAGEGKLNSYDTSMRELPSTTK